MIEKFYFRVRWAEGSIDFIFLKNWRWIEKPSKNDTEVIMHTNKHHKNVEIDVKRRNARQSFEGNSNMEGEGGGGG